MRSPKPIALVAAAAISLGAVGCGSSSHPPSARATVAAPDRCVKVAMPTSPGSPKLTAPTRSLDPARTYTVTFSTSCGRFSIRLDARHAPRTAASFAYLVKRGFFDGLTFHRVSAGFVIQGGDPAGDGSGGPGYMTVEPPPAKIQYGVGDVAMAKTQSDPRGAAGSQFFVVLTPRATTVLTPDYARVGHVSSGMATVARIGELPTSPPGDGQPTMPVVIQKATLSVS